MVGLGHLRRTLTIAGRLVRDYEDATSLVLTGSAIAPFFELPPGVDTVKLPSTTRDSHGRRRAHRLTVGLDQLETVRSSIALATAITFRPRAAVVDKYPLGLGGELEPTLAQLKIAGCKLVLGLRDIDDSPERVRRNWGDGMRHAIERYYDAVLVYGPEAAPDAIACMGWNDLAVPVHHVGYLGGPPSGLAPEDLPPGYLLATVGGGRDGYDVLAGVADAIRVRPLSCHTVLVTGPLMADAEIRRLQRLVKGLDAQVWRFRTDMSRVVAGARAVVGMAGYNSVAEVMRAHKPALFVPRVRPSQEQLMRARCLAEGGVQDMLHPDEVSPETMRAALERLLTRPAPTVRPEHYDGSARSAAIVARLAGVPPTTHRERVEHVSTLPRGTRAAPVR